MVAAVVMCGTGGQSDYSTFHLFYVSDYSKLYLRNVSLRQESSHSERHGVFVTEGLYWGAACGWGQQYYYGDDRHSSNGRDGDNIHSSTTGAVTELYGKATVAVTE